MPINQPLRIDHVGSLLRTQAIKEQGQNMQHPK